jgi:hypothetical protein
MADSTKEKIYQLLSDIEDENVLNQLMQDVSFYASRNDSVNELTPNQMQELDMAIKEADERDTINWDDFKKELNEWRKK